MESHPKYDPMLSARQRLHRGGIFVLAIILWTNLLRNQGLFAGPGRSLFHHLLAGPSSSGGNNLQIYHIQIRLMGRNSWQDLNFNDGTLTNVFESLQRLDVVSHLNIDDYANPLFLHLASWVSNRWRDIFPEHASISDVRFLISTWSKDHQISALQTSGAWVRPPIEGAPASKLRILATYRVAVPKGHKAILVPNESAETFGKVKSSYLNSTSSGTAIKIGAPSALKFKPAPYKQTSTASDRP